MRGASDSGSGSRKVLRSMPSGWKMCCSMYSSNDWPETTSTMCPASAVAQFEYDAFGAIAEVGRRRPHACRLVRSQPFAERQQVLGLAREQVTDAAVFEAGRCAS